MPYDDPILKELGGYFKAEEPGRRARADAWATAIGLQKVDGLTPSQFLLDTAKDHIEGRITQNQARRRIRDYYAAQAEVARPDPDKEEADKVSERNELKSRYLLIGLTEEDKQKIRELTEGVSGQKKAVRKKRLEKSGKKTVEVIWELLKVHPNITLAGLVKALGITRSTIQKHIVNLKAAGRLRRIGPDKGGHWEVVERGGE